MFSRVSDYFTGYDSFIHLFLRKKGGQNPPPFCGCKDSIIFYTKNILENFLCVKNSYIFIFQHITYLFWKTFTQIRLTMFPVFDNLLTHNQSKSC